MSMFEELTVRMQTFYPKVTINYKNQALLMKVLSILLFFTPAFMTSYITTIGYAIYFPSPDFIKKSPVSSSVILLHELVHVYDAERFSRILFGLLYLSPQILFLLIVPMIIIKLIVGFSWLWLLVFVLFLGPIPSYFRMYFERKAYTYSLYTMNQLNIKGHYSIDLNKQADFFTEQFTGSAYYFMWPFSSIKVYFYSVIEDFKAGKKPAFQKELTDRIDTILG
jgi:hypothetical protein